MAERLSQLFNNVYCLCWSFNCLLFNVRVTWNCITNLNYIDLLSPNIERLLVLEVCFVGLGLLVTRSCNIAVTDVQIGTEDLEDEDGYKYDIITVGVAHVEEEKAGEEQEK